MKTKEQKRSEAIERKAEYDKLSAEQKLSKLNRGNFIARKQRNRLYKEHTKEVSYAKAKKA